ncbi:dTDP-4-dehydrorhamnose 3,5-epimerase [Hydrobacter penzbergensis]|uniref:dTDP-4-dehydrorhamnose 3,5-epimerase n=1 Tax=Hydrobacter penzbergensis TaxID=1235997 RepID=A0A8X8IJE9_9BACT|nr:dTDP-4-dehydrorhamnose 3,5-epimerase [Hydrobacter penzbergensis]SDX43742.1 dTDP-4-dehydrorhamnose 3,5-epimerase [Hydrobacter penzbergensis]
MRVESTKLEGCFIIHDTVFGDQRGYFFESFNKKTFLQQTGIDVNFVQDNQSRSQKGVLRGLHFQHGEFAQSKLVRVLEGKVLDIAVDLRKKSPTYSQHIAVELSGESRTQFYVPRGFAHGFVVLSETATFFYKCDNYYNKASEGGIIYNDPELGIDWGLPQEQLLLSEKDTVLPTLKMIANELNF